MIWLAAEIRVLYVAVWLMGWLRRAVREHEVHQTSDIGGLFLYAQLSVLFCFYLRLVGNVYDKLLLAWRNCASTGI